MLLYRCNIVIIYAFCIMMFSCSIVVVVVVVYGFGLVTIQPGLFLELRSISYFGKSICTSNAGPGRSACFETVVVLGEGSCSIVIVVVVCAF